MAVIVELIALTLMESVGPTSTTAPTHRQAMKMMTSLLVDDARKKLIANTITTATTANVLSSMMSSIICFPIG